MVLGSNVSGYFFFSFGPGEYEYLLSRCHVVDVVAESDKEIKEEGRAAIVHLQLHSPAALKGVAGADDEGKVVSPQLGVCVGRVGVCVAGRRQDGAALDARFCLQRKHSC